MWQLFIIPSRCDMPLKIKQDLLYAYFRRSDFSKSEVGPTLRSLIQFFEISAQVTFALSLLKIIQPRLGL